jgi:hypothetical protein
MDKTTQLHPTIADLLEHFFGSYKPAATGALRHNIDLVRSHLSQHLEVEGPRELTTQQLAILDADRAFDPVSAFARTMHAPELYYVLGGYLGSEFAMEPVAQRQTQIDVVAALASFLWSRRLISQNTVSECALIEFDIAIERARRPGRATRGGSTL